MNAQLIRDITTIDHNYYIRFAPDGAYPGGTVMLGKYKAGQWMPADALYQSRGVARFGEEVYPGAHNVVQFGRIAAALEAQLTRLLMQGGKECDGLAFTTKASRILDIYWVVRTAELIEDYLRPPGSKEVIVADDVAGDGLSGGFVDICDRTAMATTMDTMVKPPACYRKPPKKKK